MEQEEAWKLILHEEADGKFDQALKSIDDYLQGYPEDADAYLKRINIRLKVQSRAIYKMLEDAESALRLRPDDPEVMLETANWYKICSRYFDEMDLYGKLIERFPENFYYLIRRLECRVKFFKEPKAFRAPNNT